MTCNSNTHMTEISSSIALSTLMSSNYSVDASSGNKTLTLPLIISDGENFTLTRYDFTENTVSLASTSPNLIYENKGSVGVSSLLVLPQTSFQVQSLNGSWYVTINGSINRIESKILFSCVFGLTSTSIAGSLSRVVMCTFPYEGRQKEIITKVIIVINNTGGPSGTISLTNSGGSTTYGSVSFTAVSGIRQLAITSFTGLPTSSTLMEVGVTIPLLTSITAYSIIVK